MTEGTPAVAAQAPSRARAVASYALVGIAGILLLLTTFAVWVDRVALETEVFADTSAELIEDETIRRAVATRTIDEIYDSVDVEEELEGPLPEDVESLAGPTAATLREVGPGIVQRALAQPRLQRLWRESVERSHAALLDVLEERRGTVTSEEGVVTLDLGDIVLEAADRLGVRDTVAERLDEDAGRVEILRSDDLDTAQDAVRILNALAWVLPLLTLAVFALAVWLAGRRRRLTVRAIGLAVFLSGVVGLLAVNAAGWYVVGELATDRESRAAGGNAWATTTELLRGSFRLQILLGVLVVVAAWIAGPSARALAVRRGLAPVLRQRRYAYGALAVVVLALLFTGRVDDFAQLLAELVLVGLLVAWIEWLRRQTMVEFPEATGPTILAGAGTQVAGWLEGSRRATAPRGQAESPADLTSRLRQLADLHARGELTDEEYAAAKARVLGGS